MYIKLWEGYSIERYVIKFSLRLISWFKSYDCFKYIFFYSWISYSKKKTQKKYAKKLLKFAWTEGINCYVFIQMLLSRISIFEFFYELFSLRERGLSMFPSTRHISPPSPFISTPSPYKSLKIGLKIHINIIKCL